MDLTTAFWMPQKMKQKWEARHALDGSSGLLETTPHQPHLAGTVLVPASYLKLDIKIFREILDCFSVLHKIYCRNAREHTMTS